MSKKNKKAMKQEQKQEVKHDAKAQDVKQQEQPKQEAKQQTAKKEEPVKKEAAAKEEKNWLEQYTSTDSTAARAVTQHLMSGGSIDDLVAFCKAYNQSKGKGCKWGESASSVKSHLRWLKSKPGVKIVEDNGSYRLSA